MLRNRSHFSPAAGLLAVVVTILGASFARSQAEENAFIDKVWQLNLRSRVATSPDSDRFHTLLSPETWESRQTAVIVCDMWDSHHSPNAVDRVNELAPRLEAFVQVARNAGATVIHAPSDCMAFYAEHPARQRAQQVPPAINVPSGMDRWCTQIPAEEVGVYPIDQADGGEDDDPARHAAWAEQNRQAGRNPSLPWLRQHPGISIDANVDYVTDQGPEVWAILEQRGIKNVILVGVHVNMCVLGRPFGLRNMVTAGKRTVLVRDLTDSMYNPARWPYVNHHTGTDLIIQHIERYVCPTITSDQIVGGQPFRFASDQRTRLAVLVAEPEYDTARSLTRFAAEHLGKDFQVEIIHGSETDKADFPSLSLLTESDAALLSIRRRPLKPEQMAIVREFVKSGKPLIGIRTASHPFHLQKAPSENGTEFEEWPEFDAEVWGGNYMGHYGVAQLPRITSNEENLRHPVLGGESIDFHSTGSLYQNTPLRPGTITLLWGRIEGAPPHPVAWTFVRSDGGRSFYTSLGHVGDFEQTGFQQILLRGLRWATRQEPVPAPKNEQGFWQSKPPATMPGTRTWQWDGDVADAMVAGIDRFLLRKIDAAQNERFEHWKQLWSDNSRASPLELERYRLAKQLGVHRADSATERTVDMRLVASPDGGSLMGRTQTYEIHRVTWKSFDDVWSHGLLVRPIGQAPIAHVIAVPDCEVWPEQLIGLNAGVPPVAQYARTLAASGCQVLIPLLVNRKEKIQGITNREWLHRSAFEMGRSLLGYEVQEMMSAIDWFHQSTPNVPVVCVGYGEGGLLSILVGALDERVKVVVSSGYFGSRQEVWCEPLDRNLFGRLNYFGDAELATLIAPRTLIVEAVAGPTGQWQGGLGAPAELKAIPLATIDAEWNRMNELLATKAPGTNRLVTTDEPQHPGTVAALRSLFEAIGVAPETLNESVEQPTWVATERTSAREHEEKIQSLDQHTQHLLHNSRLYRDHHVWTRLDFSSLNAYEQSAASLRQQFSEEVIGRFSDQLLNPRPQSRFLKESEKWIAYEISLDVFPDVPAYGLLLIPKDLQVGQRRPVVVCQHGLEGRPQDTIGEPGYEYYQAFAAKLADEGYVTFAPQNPYIFGDRFRTLQRKANSIGKTLFSVITPQHQQIVNWLKSQPFVDGDRIAFYGLSYGGKTAMRVPALVTDYCLSICSADFNEWVDKNASTTNSRSYVNTGEYEIFEFDLGHTFNYAEMAALIAPRPFMVERGHADGVADDWTVAWEYSRVQNLYAARLKIPERTEIEWFDGPHRINGQQTFQFLQTHLRPK